MNILHVSLGLPPYRTGGLTKYSVDLMLSQKELSHQVSLLYPGHYNLTGSLSIKTNKSYRGIHIYEIVNPLPISLLGGIKKPGLYMRSVNKRKYSALLSEIQPDVIHIHALMGVHKEFLEAAKEQQIKIVFTTHDYFGLCPKVNLMDPCGSLCNDYEEGTKCIQCNVTGYSMLKIYLMQSQAYRQFKNNSVMKKIRNHEKNRFKSIDHVENQVTVTSTDNRLASEYVGLRNYYLDMLSLVDSFHFNSSVAESEYKKYLDIKGKIIPITHRNIQDFRELKPYEDKTKPLNITYLGPVDKYKGFYLLKEALNQLNFQKDWHLNVYGDSILNGIEYDPDYFTFHGRYEYCELKQIFNHTDLLIIPSIWKETFGFIGLEALSYGVPTLISEYVGFKDNIKNGKTGITFIPNVSKLKDNLISILNNRELLITMNQNILKMDFSFTMDRHVAEIIDFYNEIEAGGKEISYEKYLYHRI